MMVLRFGLACFLAALLSDPATAGCRSSQAGCQGYQAQAGCVGKQASGGCVGQNAGCYGLFGGGRFRHREVVRVRTKGYMATYSTPSATPPANPPLPMPKKADAGAFNSNVVLLPSIAATSDALDAANAQRAKRGLRPFQRDEGLMAGALACARYRANNRIHGHVSSGRGDFGFLPAGASASAAGCSALEPSFGFLTCCLFESWTYAGAAQVKGADGKMYCQLFVKN